MITLETISTVKVIYSVSLKSKKGWQCLAANPQKELWYKKANGSLSRG